MTHGQTTREPPGPKWAVPATNGMARLPSLSCLAGAGRVAEMKGRRGSATTYLACCGTAGRGQRRREDEAAWLGVEEPSSRQNGLLRREFRRLLHTLPPSPPHRIRHLPMRETFALPLKDRVCLAPSPSVAADARYRDLLDSIPQHKPSSHPSMFTRTSPSIAVLPVIPLGTFYVSLDSDSHHASRITHHAPHAFSSSSI
ncbi:uncharacterized protein J3D65DRAFT_301742 [Phyllosticta citribraziliensis]|uniref:Uncharacterized protein n=1 Tax=Phyllosticta citribraziliensis TaxID=989973 RepID=A0ABR1M1I4_9PEZI